MLKCECIGCNNPAKYLVKATDSDRKQSLAICIPCFDNFYEVKPGWFEIVARLKTDTKKEK